MSELVDSLTEQLEREVEEHNALAAEIAKANEELLVRRGGIQKLQEIIQRERSKELSAEAAVEPPEPEETT